MSSFVFKFYLGHYSEERRDVVLLHCVRVMRTGGRSSREYRRLLYFIVKE